MDFSQEIEQLAARKSFPDLAPEERVRVLAEMPEEEYESLRRLLSALPQLGSDATPPPALRARLLQQMKAQPGPLAPWRTAARMTLLLGAGALGGWLLRGSALPVAPAAPTQPAARLWVHDTIYVDKVVEVVRWRTRMVTRQEAAAPYVPPMAIAPPTPAPGIQQEPGAAQWMEAAPTMGTPLSATPELMEFFTQSDNR